MNDLIWLCEMCGLPIAEGTGSLFVRLAVVTDALQAQARKTPPDDIRWESSHFACRVYPDDDCYEITPGQIGTWPKLCHWTAHLMEKSWLPLSDWDAVLREASGEGRVPWERARLTVREAA